VEGVLQVVGVVEGVQLVDGVVLEVLWVCGQVEAELRDE